MAYFLQTVSSIIRNSRLSSWRTVENTCHKIEVTEYQCAKCSYKWINWINGKEGSKPKRCAKCKRWDWEEGYLSRIEKQLRRDLLEIEENQIKHSTLLDGTGFYSISTDICATFLNVYPRPTVKELMTVLNPICYLGPNDHSHSPVYSHNGTCSEQVDCGPGWIPIHDKLGSYDFDRKICEEMERKEKDVRHELMQHITDSREGIVNTNSTHYQYFENKKLMAKSLNESDPREMLARAMMGKEG